MKSGFRWLTALVLAVALAFTVTGLASAAKLKIAMVTDVGGLGDKSFNDSAYEGLLRVEKKLKADIRVVESRKMEDYEPNLRALAEAKFDMIWAVGFLMTDAVAKIAPMYPNIKFGIIDSVVDAPNVMSVTFKEEEGSFLQGVIAGLATKSNTVGFVGGMDAPIIVKFEAGFIAGVKAVNPKAKVLVAYTGSFTDAVKGKELALAQIANGADVIYHASGACGTGVIKACGEKNILAIGVDSDQSPLDPKHVISSMMKRVGNALFMGSQAVAKKAFKPGLTVLGLKEDGVGSAYSAGVDESLSKTKIAAIKKQVDSWAKKIKSGKVKVPTTR